MSKEYVFDSTEEVEKFFEELSKKESDVSLGKFGEWSVEAVPFTHTKIIDNRDGPTKLRWVGLRMEQRGDPKIYVHLTERIIERGDLEQADLTYLQKYVFRYSWYFNWWDGQSWQYVPNALPTEAPAGKYYPAIGIRFRPALKPAADGEFPGLLESE